MSFAFWVFCFKLCFYSLAVWLIINSNIVNNWIEYFFDCSLVELAGPLSFVLTIIEQFVYFYCFPFIIFVFLDWFLLFFNDEKDQYKEDYLDVNIEDYYLEQVISAKFLEYFESDTNKMKEFLSDPEILTYVLNIIANNIDIVASFLIEKQQTESKLKGSISDYLVEDFIEGESFLEFLEENKYLENLAHAKYGEIKNYLKKWKKLKDEKKDRLEWLAKAKNQQEMLRYEDMLATWELRAQVEGINWPQTIVNGQLELKKQEYRNAYIRKRIAFERNEKFNEIMDSKEVEKIFQRMKDFDKRAKIWANEKEDWYKEAGLYRIRLIARGRPDKAFEEELKELEEWEIMTWGEDSFHTKEKKKRLKLMAEKIKKVELELWEAEKKNQYLLANELRWNLKNLIEDERYYIKIRKESKIFWEWFDFVLYLRDLFLIESSHSVVAYSCYFVKNIQFDLFKLNIFINTELIFFLYKRFLLLFQISKMLYLEIRKVYWALIS